MNDNTEIAALTFQLAQTRTQLAKEHARAKKAEKKLAQTSGLLEALAWAVNIVNGCFDLEGLAGDDLGKKAAVGLRKALEAYEQYDAAERDAKGDGNED